ncbi:MAG: hypothetical protein A2W28_03115 [Gammaproteobacteria bacterium RBG_16_51_14]|nr:MAG: hypothetical protein A2W28_03115 [Gammaproteobacteria bacterium RBG_16_51_14]
MFADAAQLPLADSSADAVLLLEVLEHVEQFEQVLAEIQRILKADGELYLSAPFIYPAHDVPYDFHRFTRHGLVKDLARHGLNVVTIKQHGNSFVVALQMLNLSLLEQVKKTMDCSSVMGLLLAIFCYPLCITINLLALLLLGLNNSNAAVFGHFVVARPVRPQCESN